MSSHLIRPPQALPPQPTSSHPSDPPSIPTCANCATRTTPLWRRDDSGATLCNACALFQKMKGRPRPISLKTDVIKQRNRLKAVDRDPNREPNLRQHPARSKKPPHQPPGLVSNLIPVTISIDPSSPPLRPQTGLSLPPDISQPPFSSLQTSQHRQPTRSRDPARSRANARKSDPGGVIDHPQSNETDRLADGVYHSNGSKRRKDHPDNPSADAPSPSSHHPLSQRLLRRSKPSVNSHLLHELPSGSLRSRSLAGTRSASRGRPRSTVRLGASLGSPSDFGFEFAHAPADSSSADSLETSVCSDSPDRTLSHPSQAFSLTRGPPADSFTFSSAPSPLARSVSVDRSPVLKSIVNLPHVQSQPGAHMPLDDRRGRSRFREPITLPPLSQLVSRVSFSPQQSPGVDPRFHIPSATSTPFEHSPGRTTCGPPLSFEASAREARQQSPHSQACRTAENLPRSAALPTTIHTNTYCSTSPHLYPATSSGTLTSGVPSEYPTRACSVGSSASDNGSVQSTPCLDALNQLPDPSFEPVRFLAIQEQSSPATHQSSYCSDLPSHQPDDSIAIVADADGFKRGRSETRKAPATNLSVDSSNGTHIISTNTIGQGGSKLDSGLTVRSTASLSRCRVNSRPETGLEKLLNAESSPVRISSPGFGLGRTGKQAWVTGTPKYEPSDEDADVFQVANATDEVVRLRHRVAELELINGMMKSRIGQLEQGKGVTNEMEEEDAELESHACSTVSSSLHRLGCTPMGPWDGLVEGEHSSEFTSAESTRSSSWERGIGLTRMEIDEHHEHHERRSDMQTKLEWTAPDQLDHHHHSYLPEANQESGLSWQLRHPCQPAAQAETEEQDELENEWQS